MSAEEWAKQVKERNERDLVRLQGGCYQFSSLLWAVLGSSRMPPTILLSPGQFANLRLMLKPQHADGDGVVVEGIRFEVRP